MIIQAVLLVHFLLPAQTPSSQSPSETTKLVQSATDAENRDDLDQAIANLRKAVELDPSSPTTLLKLGDAYMRKHDYGAAILPLKRAAELSPDSLQVHQLLGYALLSQGYATEAIPHLEEDRNNPYSMELLSRACAEAGTADEMHDVDGALRALNAPTIEQALVVPVVRAKPPQN